MRAGKILRRFRAGLKRQPLQAKLVPALESDPERLLDFAPAFRPPVLAHFPQHLINGRLSRTARLRQPRQVRLRPSDRPVPHLLVEFGGNRLVRVQCGNSVLVHDASSLELAPLRAHPENPVVRRGKSSAPLEGRIQGTSARCCALNRVLAFAYAAPAN